MKTFTALCLSSAIVGFVYANKNVDDVNDVFPGDDTWKTGYVDVNERNSDLFYWVFDSRSDPESDPLVMWLTGGPGCASEIALFYENGPYHFDDAGNMYTNEYSWNNSANLLYVD